MDETNLSWRALLAKSNINILDVHDDCVFIEFTYHPKSGQKPGVFKWCKTMLSFPEYDIVVPDDAPEKWYKVKNDRSDVAQQILEEVLSLRKELER